MLEIIQKFDINKKYSLLILIGIVSIWAIISSFELTFPYENCKDFGIYTQYGVGLCTDYGMRLMQLYHLDISKTWENPLALGIVFIFLITSNIIFGDYRILSFISSGLLLAITYFLTVKITGKNYSGLVSVLFLLHSPIFWKYDLTITYPTFWATFFLGSLYFLYKSYVASIPLYLLGISAKILNLLNFPVMLAFIILSDIKHKKKLIIIYCGSLAVLMISLHLFSKDFTPFVVEFFKFRPEEFLWYLGMWSLKLSNDKITIVVIFTSLVFLFMLRRAKVKNASALLLSILLIMIQPAIISGFSDYTNEEYRFLVLVAITGISLSLIIANPQIIKYQANSMMRSMQKRKTTSL